MADPIRVFRALAEEKLLAALRSLDDVLRVQGTLTAAEAVQALTPLLGEERTADLVGSAAPRGELGEGELGRLWVSALGGDGAPEPAVLALTLANLKDEANQAKRRFELRLLQAGAEVAAPKNDGYDLAVQAASGITLACEAPVALPAGLDATAPGLEPVLRAKLEGSLVGSASLAATAGTVSAGISGGLGRELAMAFYFRQPWSATLGAATAHALHAIGAHRPLSVSGLAGMLAAPGVRPEAVTFDARQEWHFAGRFGLGLKREAGGNALSLGMELGFGLRESGTFRFVVTRQGERLHVHLSRVDTETTERRHGVSVAVDLQGLAQGLYPKLAGYLGDARDHIQRVLDLLPEEGAVRAALAEHLGQALSGFEPAAEVLDALGTLEGGDPRQVLAQRLAERIERAADLWQGKGQEAAQSIAAEVAGRLALSPDIRDRLRQALAQALPGALDRLEGLLKDRLTDRVTGTDFTDLTGSLQVLGALGRRVDTEVTEIDRRVQKVIRPVREVLTRYQGWLSRVAERLEDAASYRIQAAFFAESQEEAGRTLDLEFEVDLRQMGAAQDILERVLRGEMATVFDEMVNGRADGALTVSSLTRARLGRYVRLQAKQGYDLVLLGFDLGRSTLLDTETRVERDAQGDLAVLSRASHQELWQWMKQRRRFDFIDTYRLGGQAGAGRLSVALALFHEEDQVSREDARAFLGSAQGMGLLPKAALERAEAVIGGLADADFARARLNLGMTLTRRQVARLLEYGQPDLAGRDPATLLDRVCPVPSSSAPAPGFEDDVGFLVNFRERPPAPPAIERPLSARRDAAMAAAARHTARAVTLHPSETVKLDEIEEWLRQGGLSGSLVEAFQVFDPDTQREVAQAVEQRLDFDRVIGSLQLDRQLTWVHYRHKAITRLTDEVLVDLWAMARSASANWPDAARQERLAACQKAISEALAVWFQRAEQQSWAIGLHAEARPLTLALIKTIAHLATADPNQGGPQLSAELMLLDGQGRVTQTHFLG